MTTLFNKTVEKYKATNRLMNVIFEVTHRCPCDCIHCFLVKERDNELTTEEIIILFKQLQDEGVLTLTLTGGEPFLRDDISQILYSAREKQFFISILTTGILIDHAEVNLINETGVSDIEISLLGSNSDTHDTIMRCPGAFNRMLRAVKLMRNEDINIKLKSTIMKQNYKELPDMAKLAQKYDVHFSASVVISPRVNGDTSILELSLNNDEISRLDPDLINEGLIPGEVRGNGAILTCNAGKINASISPQGDIYPCVIMRHDLGNIRNIDINNIWHFNPDPFLMELRDLKDEGVYECYSCNYNKGCYRCPGIAYTETKKLVASVPSVCKNIIGID